MRNKIQKKFTNRTITEFNRWDMIIRPLLMKLLGVSKMQEELLEHRRNKRKIGLVPFEQYISPKSQVHL